MGQEVEINGSVVVGDVLVLDTDRSFTGQDGQVLAPQAPGEGVPGLLGGRLFSLGLGIDHVFVLQNTITARRPGGWDDAAAERVAEVTREFLLFYDEDEVVEEELAQTEPDLPEGEPEPGTEEWAEEGDPEPAPAGRDREEEEAGEEAEEPAGETDEADEPTGEAVEEDGPQPAVIPDQAEEE